MISVKNKDYIQNSREMDILQSYIVPNYEALHTQGKDYIVDDIIDLMEKKGVHSKNSKRFASNPILRNGLISS